LRLLKNTAVFLCMTASFCLYSQSNSSGISFRWGVQVKNSTGVSRFVEMNQPLEIQTGDTFRFYICPIRGAYIYLIYFGSDNSVTSVFPLSFNNFEVNSGIGVSVPSSETNWLFFDGDSGEEQFHLLALSARSANLERLITEYNRISNNGTVINNRTISIRQRILDEITTLKRANSSFVTVAERPVSVAGVSRGMYSLSPVENSGDVVTEVSAERFYAKILRFRH